MTTYAGGSSNGVLFNKDGVQTSSAGLIFDDATDTLKVKNLNVQNVFNAQLPDNPAPVVLQFTAHLTTEQLLGLGNGMVDVLPAPGEGKVYCIQGAVCNYHFGTKQFVVDANDRFAVGCGGNNWGGISVKTLLGYGPAADWIFQINPGIEDNLPGSININQKLSPNQPISVFTYMGTAVTEGDGTMDVTIYYSILDV